MSADPPRAPDAIVIGGGIIGCATALRLAQAGVKVVVIERGEPGAEASGAAAGMLAPQGETTEPGPFFDLCAASRDLYPSFVAEVEELSGESVGYRRDGTLLVAVGEDDSKDLEAIHKAQSRLGLPLEWMTAEAVLKRVPGLSRSVRSGLFIPGDHWVDNQRLTRALVQSCQRAGVAFRPHVPATRLNVRNARVESVTLGSGETLSAARVVLAAGCWSGELAASVGMSLGMAPCRGQMIEFEGSSELPVIVRSGHHYLVPRADGRTVAGTTAEYVGYDQTVTGEGLRSILEGTLRFAPLVKELRFCRAWAGLRPDTPDHLPILGRGEIENLVLATGHFRNGILLAPLTARLVSELVLNGSTSRPIDAYRPLRFASPGKK